MKKSAIDRKKTAKQNLPRVMIRLYERYTNKDNKHPVYIIVYLQNKRVMFLTGVNVKSDEWDDKEKLVKKTVENASDYNLIISNSRAKVSDIFVKYRLFDKEITPAMLKDEYARPSLNIDFLAFMEREILNRRGELTDTTINQHKAQLSKLRQYKSEVAFADLSEELFQNFNRWMISNMGNNANTRHNCMKTIRTYVYIARRKGLIQHNPMSRLPVKKTQPNRVFLEEDEVNRLLQLYDKNALSKTNQFVLRHFLFGCYTGLRISDIKGITMDDIVGDMLVLVPHKTKNVNAKTVKIPLTKTAKRLVNDESPYRIHGKIFHTISEQKMREYLKLIVKMADIDKKVNFHTARHTFATLFLRKTKNLPVLQKLLGHQSITQTMIYSHILPDDLVAEMKVFDG